MARQQFLSEMETKLKEFDLKMERLAAHPTPRDEGAKLEREKTYFFLKASRAELREKLRQAQYTPDESWREFKGSLENLYEGMAQQMAKSNGNGE